nr:zinc finger protein-like 1 homolog [Tanacetum cinerariifolium]
IWPPKSVKDSGSRLHSLLKEAIIQTGMEKNVFGNNPVSMSTPLEHPVTKEALGGNGSARPSSIDIVEIDAPNSANHVRSPPSGVVNDTVPGGHPRHHRPSRMDPRKILLVIAIMACLATMGILYYRIAQRGFGEEQLPQGEEQ